MMSTLGAGEQPLVITTKHVVAKHNHSRELRFMGVASWVSAEWSLRSGTPDSRAQSAPAYGQRHRRIEPSPGFAERPLHPKDCEHRSDRTRVRRCKTDQKLSGAPQ